LKKVIRKIVNRKQLGFCHFIKLMYREWESNRKSGSVSQNIESPPYFHFRFGRQRTLDARFCSILANMAAVSPVMARRPASEVKVSTEYYFRFGQTRSSNFFDVACVFTA